MFIHLNEGKGLKKKLFVFLLESKDFIEKDVLAINN